VDEEFSRRPQKSQVFRDSKQARKAPLVADIEEIAIGRRRKEGMRHLIDVIIFFFFCSY